jgi:hypothetical protein
MSSTAGEAPETSNSTTAVDSTVLSGSDISLTATPNAPDTEWAIYLGIALALLCCLILIVVALVLVRRRRAAAAANKRGAEMQPTDYFLVEDDSAKASAAPAPRQNIYASTPLALGQSPTTSVIYDSAI